VGSTYSTRTLLNDGMSAMVDDDNLAGGDRHSAVTVLWSPRNCI